ncbi:MAG: MCE family protein [Alphaproteobacteria bacterium]|jgi:phospholipid/cholesterol/gamma-HCH transport system substrate-binding protein|nr:MCE family protein [Alphaproteobacteria bacterium]
METRANYLLVGSFVLIAFAGTIIFVLWLAKFQFDEQFTRYDIEFDGSVSGLKIGSTVELNGIPVGEVIGIAIDHRDVEKVNVTIEVPSDTPIRQDTVASMQIKGITGGISVQLSGGTQASPPLVPEAGEDRAVISSKASALDKFLEGAPELLESLQTLVARAAILLGPENQTSFAQTLSNLSTISGALAARSGDVDSLLTDASSTMTNLRSASAAMTVLAERAQTTLTSVGNAADSVTTTVTDNKSDVEALIKDLRTTTNAFTSMSQEMTALVSENRQPLRDFTGDGLYELTNFMTEARALMDSLTRVSTQVERDPARFLFGNQQQGYETPK